MYSIYIPSMAIKDGPNLDAFSRLRVSNPIGLFDSTFQYDLQTRIYWQDTANGGTVSHTAAYSSSALVTAAQQSSMAAMQTKLYHRYIPAKSQLIVMTQVVGAAVTGVTKRVGYFDSNDGIFLSQTLSGLAFVRRSSTSGSPQEESVPQYLWDLDRLDGSGPSRIRFDVSKASILVIDLQWLGMGRVRVGFDIGGQIVYAHEFLNANVLSVPYMRTANLPIRWEVSGNGVATMYATCASVISEGGAEFDRGYLAEKASGTVTAASGARTCIVAIRPKTTLNSIVNRLQITPDMFGAIVTGDIPVLWEVLYDPTISGGSWVSAGSDSAVEYNITATSISAGTGVDAFFVPALSSAVVTAAMDSAYRLPLVLDISGSNPIALALVATGIDGTSTCQGSITWRELR